MTAADPGPWRERQLRLHRAQYAEWKAGWANRLAGGGHRNDFGAICREVLGGYLRHCNGRRERDWRDYEYLAPVEWRRAEALYEFAAERGWLAAYEAAWDDAAYELALEGIEA